MPIAAFLETSAAREAAGQAISSYALVVRKQKMHEVGANPAIYGLSDRYAQMPPYDKDGGPRIISQTLLPLAEQYRYITYAPTGLSTVDWTHEREWRWPCDMSEKAIQELDEFGHISESSDIPGLDISHAPLSGIGIIVKSDTDAKKLSHDVLTLVDRGDVGRKHFRYILVRDKLPKPSDLYSPAETNQAIIDATLDFDDYFKLPKEEEDVAVSDLSQRASAIEKSTPRAVRKEGGGCWLWFFDSTHPYVRALVQAGRVAVNKHGHYLAELPEFSMARDLREREEMTLSLAADIKAAYGLDGSYFSVLNKVGFNDIPFFVGDNLDDQLTYNWAY